MPDYNPYAGLVEEVLDLVRDWQIEGRNGHCLPVIRGRLLEGLEEAANDRARDNCSNCHGMGNVSDGYEDNAVDLIERLRLGDGSSPDRVLLLEAAKALEEYRLKYILASEGKDGAQKSIAETKPRLEKLAARECWCDEDGFMVDDYAGGNIDDAYSGGYDDGVALLARSILDELDWA